MVMQPTGSIRHSWREHSAHCDAMDRLKEQQKIERREIGIALLVAALRRKLGGAGENGEGVLLADAIECRMRQQFSTWAALEPNCFSKANIRAHAALQYDGLVGPRKTGVRARTG